MNQQWEPQGTARGRIVLLPGMSTAAGPGPRGRAGPAAPDRFVVLDGGHCLHRDLPDRWVRVVGGFADAVVG